MPKGPRPRDTKRYELTKEGKVVYVGITKRPLVERAAEHEAGGKRFTNIRQVGPSVTDERARAWEQERIKQHKKSHRGKPPAEQG